MVFSQLLKRLFNIKPIKLSKSNIDSKINLFEIEEIEELDEQTLKDIYYGPFSQN